MGKSMPVCVALKVLCLWNSFVMSQLFHSWGWNIRNASQIHTVSNSCNMYCIVHITWKHPFLSLYYLNSELVNATTECSYVFLDSIYYRIQKWWAEREGLHFPEISMGSDKFIKTEVQLLPKTSCILGKLICTNHWKRYPAAFGRHS